MRMKVVLFSFVAVLAAGCSSVSSGSANAYGESEMRKLVAFHDREYMEDRKLETVPSGVDESSFPQRSGKNGKTQSPFASLPDFEQTTRDDYENGRSSDGLSSKIFQALKEDCENKMAATNRFPVAQIRHGLADNSVRRATRNGTANAAEFDTSELMPGNYIFNVKILVTTKDMLSGSTNEKIITMEWKCVLVDARNNQPVDEIPAFSISVEDTIVQKVGRTGRVIEGVRWDSPIERESILLNLSRMAQLKFLNYIYEAFPVGGYITDIDLEDDIATVRASRATGLLPNMEMVIYAREKDNDEANRIALFNATCQPSKKGTSTIKIWRYAKAKNAKRIISMLEDDKDAAKEKYDFFAVSDGIAEPPPFIQTNVSK